MRNILLKIEYDGSGFSGWQRQPGKRTVQGELERVLSIICSQELTIAGTSRTDAGVHAYGQQATLKGDFKIPTDLIPYAANNLLSGKGRFSIGDIRILEAVDMPENFHARFDAKGKTYLYKIRNAVKPDIMLRNYSYQILSPLDTEAMKEAIAYFQGEHDFKGFMSSGGKVPDSTRRYIYKASLYTEKIVTGSEEDRWIILEITGNGFLYNMIRIITGTLVEVGMGRISPDHIPAIIKSGKRSLAGHTAPPQGLYLARIYF